jgi:HlyD family secretion protein
MGKKTKWFFIALIALVVVLVVMKVMGAFGKDEGLKVNTEKASKRTLIETVSASGKIYPEIEVKLSPDISGEIVELNVKEGDSVRRGQVLARVYADIYDSERDRAAAAVAQSQSQVNNSSAAMQAVMVRLEQARVQYERQQKLYDDKVISKSELETAETSFKTAQADLNAAKQGIIGGQANVQSARTGLVIANKNLGRATITAPMDGVVSLLAVKKGERVVGTAQMAGTEILRIADMNKIELRVDVGENDIPKVHLGDSALVEVEAYSNRKFKGIVTQIASSSTNAGAAVATGNDVTNYKVYIRLLPESYKDLMDPARNKFPFRPGMSASADIQTKTHANVVSVPINAVTTRDKGSDKPLSEKKKDPNKSEEENGDQPKPVSADDEPDVVVFVLQKDGTVKKVKVKTDVQDISYIEITEGLKEGDEVVAGPYLVVSKTLRDGTKVQVVPKDKAFGTKDK